jgi:glycosyltransferase involved in cell wall biosynthesis
LEPRKRVSDFVEARRIAHARGWDEVYEVVGPDQGDGDAVTAAVASTPGLLYRGAVQASEIDAILSTAGVFVLTSSNEPWGNVLVAALARNIPVVVTRSAALAEEIEQSRLGLVVPDKSPAAVAEAVHQILTTQWRTSQDESAAKAFAAKRFDQTTIRETLADVYRAAHGGH